MPHITVYTGMNCPYCDRAKRLLTKKGSAFTEINIHNEAGQAEEMIKKSGGKRTIPQIFIDDRHIGGCDDLFALDASGQLDPLLAEQP